MRGMERSEGALLRWRRVPGVKVVTPKAPCLEQWPSLFTQGAEPRGKKMFYFACCHGHMEVAPL